jgi:DNA-binding NarL/FixJ family response regulator
MAGSGRGRILVIEDEERVVKNYERLLAGHATLVRAPTFEAAWHQTDATAWHENPCDDVFLDVRLPDGNGLDLLDRLTALEPRPTVAVVSGYLDSEQALLVHGRCVIAVSKPADRDTLLGVLAVLERARSGHGVVEEFARAHQLSSQETRLLVAAAREATNEEAAEELGCTTSTVRSSWTCIFEKTGRRRARDVIALLFRFAVDQVVTRHDSYLRELAPGISRFRVRSS